MFHGARVLVADDSAVNRKVASGMLERLGCRVELVVSGAAAVAACGTTSYAAVLMDCQMPEMDGYQATGRIRAAESGRRTPIVAMTASVLPGDRERCLEAGMDDHLPKPFTPEELLAALRRVGVEPAGPAPAAPEPPREAAGDGAIDPRTLSDLRALGPDFLRDSISLFLGSTPGKITAIEEALRQGDPGALREKAHALRGSCALMGARRMMELCARIEEIADDGGQGVSVVLSAVELEYRQVHAALQAEIGGAA